MRNIYIFLYVDLKKIIYIESGLAQGLAEEQTTRGSGFFELLVIKNILMSTIRFESFAIEG